MFRKESVFIKTLKNSVFYVKDVFFIKTLGLKFLINDHSFDYEGENVKKRTNVM